VGSRRVIVNAQVRPGGGAGGIEQFVAALVHSLGRLDDGPEEYVVVGPRDAADWLEPHLGPNQLLVAPPVPAAKSGVRRVLRRGFARAILASDGFFEGLRPSVVHFPYQAFVRCAAPTLYNPHDLQHVHHPEFFRREQLRYRQRAYRAACRLATAVACESRFTAEDVIAQYGVPSERVHVVRRGAPLEIYGAVRPDALEATRERLRPPSEFALFPSQAWPHKNHIRLAQALHVLRQRDGLVVNVICTGRETDHSPHIAAEVERLDLESQMRFVGYLDPLELRALYRLARFVVVPSLFEGGGFPVLEAFHEGVAVACSQLPALSEYADGAALFFDPLSVDAIADALSRLTQDGQLRLTLADRARVRGRSYSWERTARTYRAIYRKLAGIKLGAADRALLAESVPPVPG